MPPLEKRLIAELIEQGLPALDALAQGRGADVKAAIVAIRSMAGDILGRVPEPAQTTDPSGALSRALQMMDNIENDADDPLRNAYARARDIIRGVLSGASDRPGNAATQMEAGETSEVTATIAELRCVLTDARQRRAPIIGVQGAMKAACRAHPGLIRFANLPPTASSATFVTSEWMATITPASDGNTYTIFVESLTGTRG